MADKLVQLSSGTFTVDVGYAQSGTVDEAVYVLPNCTLMGMGYSTCVKLANSAGTKIYAVIKNKGVAHGDEYYMRISNLRVDGNKANQGSPSYDWAKIGIQLGDAFHSMVDHVWIYDCPSGGLYYESDDRTRRQFLYAEDVIIKNCGSGLAGATYHGGFHIETCGWVTATNIMVDDSEGSSFTFSGDALRITNFMGYNNQDVQTGQYGLSIGSCDHSYFQGGVHTCQEGGIVITDCEDTQFYLTCHDAGLKNDNTYVAVVVQDGGGTTQQCSGIITQTADHATIRPAHGIRDNTASTSHNRIIYQSSGSRSGDSVPNASRMLNSAPVIDHKFEGEKHTFTAGENLVFGELCYYKSDSKMWKTDADALATTEGLLAVAADTISADASGTFIMGGSYIRDDSWTWTAGDILYVSLTAGDFTATAPSASGDTIRIVGYAIDDDHIFFCPSNEAVAAIP
jgi:hypothetical protein